MKITSTKKLSIILLSLACSATAGLGVLFGGWFSHTPKTYAQSELSALSGGEETILEEFSQLSGIPAKALKFYAEANNGTVEILYQNYLHHREEVEEEILSFLNQYAQGRIGNEDIEDMMDEDWFLSPDEVSAYDFSSYDIGPGDTFTYFTTKTFITDDEEYWRNPNFQWGHLEMYYNLGVGVATNANAGNSYWYVDTARNVYWDSQWIYDVAWLEEGEEYTFGVYSNKPTSGIYASAMEASWFMEKYWSDKPYYVNGCNNYPTQIGTYKGPFYDHDDDPNTPEVDYIGWDDPGRTMAEWMDEFSSTTMPYTSGSNGSLNNSSYLSWDTANGSITTVAAGNHYLKLSADAPTGMYFLTFYRATKGGNANGVWKGGVSSMSGNKAVSHGVYGYGSNWCNWSYYQNYGVLVCRQGVTAPEAEYGEGVSSDLTSKTVNYTGDPINFTLKNDWGPGLSSVICEKQNPDGSWSSTGELAPKWYDPNNPATVYDRTVANISGLGIKGNVNMVATNAGKYRITYTPFRNWSDGSTDSKYYYFEIRPMLLKATTLVKEEGVDATLTHKFLNATKDKLYVSLYPVLWYADGTPESSKWVTFTAPGLTVERHSESGVLTLSGITQNTYTITVHIGDNFNQNISWDDGTVYGSINDLVFTFQIGPEKIVIPEIIQDKSDIKGGSKTVTFNGAYQTMSFLPIDPDQLTITVINQDNGEALNRFPLENADHEYYEIATNTLIVRALNAGHYKIKLEVLPLYIFAEGNVTQEVVEFELIIKEAEISAPILNEPGLDSSATKKVDTYGGEKIGEGDNTQDWVATLSFTNAYEARIKFIASDGLGKQTWGDRDLVLAARSAGTYTVKFEPLKNYKWANDVEPPVYTLEILRLRIQVPELFHDEAPVPGKIMYSEANDQKTVKYDSAGIEATFELYFPTLEATKETEYTKRSSVYIVYEGDFKANWIDSDHVVFSGTNNGLYTFVVTPTSNYCWADNTTDEKYFYFYIVPVDLQALEATVTAKGEGTRNIPFSEELRYFFAQPGMGYQADTPVEIKIGKYVEGNYAQQYVEYDENSDKNSPQNTYAKFFFLLDEGGVRIDNKKAFEEGKVTDPRLLPGMTVKVEKGQLIITAQNAGLYRIAVYLNNTNYCWGETSATVVEYRLNITAQAIAQPVVSATKGNITSDVENGTYTLSTVFRDEIVELLSTIPVENYGYLKITDPDGSTYVYDSSLSDTDATKNMQAELAKKGKVFYTYFYYDKNKDTEGILHFCVKNAETYIWTIEMEDTNYKWAGTDSRTLTFILTITRAPVTGIEMHYIGDSYDKPSSGTNDVIVGYTNVRGSDTEMDKAGLVYNTTFTGEHKEIYFKRTNYDNNWDSDFNKAFDFKINPIKANNDYTGTLTDLRNNDLYKKIYNVHDSDEEAYFNVKGLWLYALDAGTYEITLQPSSNYCWNDSANTFGSVTFKLIIKQRKLDNPVLIDENGKYDDPTLGEWTTEFNHEYQTFSLYIANFPKGYDIAADGFKYFDTEDRIGNDFADVRISGTYPDGHGGNVNLGVDENAKTLSVQAKSAGDYALIITVSNINNYYLPNGDLQYLLYIRKMKVYLPDAYLSDESLDATQAEKKPHTYSDVSGGIVIGKEETFVSGAGYTVNSDYNGRYYTVYFYGSDVTNGDFDFKVNLDTGNGAPGTDTEYKTIKPDDDLDPNSDGSSRGKAGYFMLAAMAVNEYQITLTFASKDFYWSTGTIDDKSEPRIFKFVINKNSIPVPKIYGNDYANLPLENDSYTAEFDYELDLDNSFNTANKAVPRTLELRDVLMGYELSSDPANNIYKYSNLTLSINSSVATGEVLLTAPTANSNNTGFNFKFSTSTDGTTVDGGLVNHVYCIELNVDPANSLWSTNDAKPKKYYIKINHLKVKNPKLTNTDVISETQLTRSAIYDGSEFKNALIISGYDDKFMGYYDSSNTFIPVNLLQDPTFANNTLTIANNIRFNAGTAGVRYDGEVILDAPAPAAIYTVKVPLADTDNMVWERGYSSDPLVFNSDPMEFSFTVDQVKVAKPYIENSAKSTDVSGLTKTVTYDPTKDQYLEVGNLWYNPALQALLTNPPTVTDEGGSASSLTAPVPEVMKFSVSNGSPDAIIYRYNQFATTGGNKYNSMLYNEYNNGLLKLVAKDAYRYVLRFTLTENALWADGTSADIEVTLLIKKIEVHDLVIVDDDSEASISGREKTIKYKLDSSGVPVDRILKLQGYDGSLMHFLSSTNGIVDDSVISIMGSNDGYKFHASLANTYEVTFELDDGKNYRWTYADNDKITFKLVIEKLELKDPVIFTGYKLVNETVDADSRTLTVDYDLREHTLLIRSLFEELNNGVYSNLGATYYFDVTPSADNVLHLYDLNTYDSTQGMVVKDLFEILGLPNFHYDGPDAGKTVGASDATVGAIYNVFALTAYTPGEYYLTFHIVDSNMVWFNNGSPTADDIVFKLIINKVQHAAPTLAVGETSSKEYTGDKVLFRITNAYNGINEEKETVATTTVSEKYEILDYVGDDTSVMANLTSNPKYYEETWYNGTLTLAFTSVGTYTVRVSITDTENIDWIGTSDTSRIFTFTVMPRTLTTSIVFQAPDDDEVNASLQAGATTWPISTKVQAVITIKGIRVASGSIDNVLKFKVYFENSSAIGTPLQPNDYSNTAGGWMPVPQPDGTYNLVIVYTLPYGKGNIEKSTYKLHIVQDTDYAPGSKHSNYNLPDPAEVFTVDADPAPFKKDMLEWYYSSSLYPSLLIPIVGIGGDSTNRFTDLEFVDGVTYTFTVKLNTKGMQGFENTGAPYTDIHLALNSWKVQWDGNYGGTQIVSDAGDKSVWVMITALDPNEYSFADYKFELFYRIRKAQYDLNDLTWDYDGTTPFTYDGNNHSVNVVGLSAAKYSGLSILRYTTVGTFTSGNNSYPVAQFNSNQISYAGKYTTTVYFTVPANSNYDIPDEANVGSYKGTFAWSRDWEILPQEITVDWKTSSTVDSDGNTIKKTSPVIDGTHSGKFGYEYERWDDINGVWVAVTQITRKPNTTLRYRAKAYLKSAPNSPANDFSRNYTFVIRGDNPYEFDVGGDDVTIMNHIEVDGKQETEFEYTGNPFVATCIIDLDTTNGLIYTSSMSITVLYFNKNNPSVQLSGAPKEIGQYIVKLKLSFTNVSEPYALEVDEYEFEIVKAKIRYSDFEWHVTHDDGNGAYEARYDVTQGKWINIDTNDEVKIAYDGHAYVVFLASDYADSVIRFFYTENNQINAGTYKATITPTLDDAHYEIVATDPIPAEYEWTIAKCFLDLSKMSWDYTKAYEFTLVNGKPKAFSVELKDYPDYLSDKIIYTTQRANDSMAMLGNITDAAKYKTKAEIDEDAIDFDNYDLGTWPTTVPSTLEWEIKAKQFNVPVSDLSWSEFDGVYHNLLGPLNLDIDWAEYFTVDVAYAQTETDGFVSYDGTAYGGKYYAINAGIYKFTFKIRKEYNDADNHLYNIVWYVTDTSGIYTTDTDRTTTYTVNKKSLKVTGWNNNYESSTVILEGGIDPSKFIEYKFYVGTGLSGSEAQLNDILSSAGGDTFSMTAVIKAAYTGNITLEFAEGMTYTTFITRNIDETTAFSVGERPFIYGYTVNGKFHRFSSDEIVSGETFVIYSGDSVEFKIYNWDYLKNYVTVWNGSLDDLIQTEAGQYSITFILRTDLDYDLFWDKDETTNKIRREAVTLNFEIRYRMLTIPKLPAEVVYTGSEIDVLSLVENTTYSLLLAEYGNYVEFTGNTATNVGEQVVYLTIKDDYINAVRWDNGSANGQFGTISFVWKITPILLAYPEKDASMTNIEYDGTEHSVYEFLKGYNKDDMPQSIKDLMKYVNESNGRNINAGDYTAVLSLPNTNYAWCNASGVQIEDRNPVNITWTISKKVIDFNQAYWGYYLDDSDNHVRIESGDVPSLVYTIKNGAPHAYTLQLFGMPEILKIYASYKTDGVAGGSAGEVGMHTTRVEFDLTQLNENKNYTIVNFTSSIFEQEWEIVAREFDAPEYDGSFAVFDATVHEIAELLKLGEDWSEYFEISVKYKEIDGGDWEDYDGENMHVVGYSNYRIYNYGFYLITVKIKSQGSVWNPGTNLKWKDGDPAEIKIEVSKRDVVITGWNEDNQYSTVIFKDENLPQSIKDRLEYVIYEDGDLNETPLSPEDIQGGKTYYVKFTFKKGPDIYGVAYSYGINLIYEDGVANPYEFGTYSFGSQNLLWMPIPVLETAVLEYNGSAQTFVIKDFEALYKLTDEQRIQLNIGLDASVKSFVYLQNANSLTATAAGEYSAVVKLQGKIYLSWYDSTLYYASSDYRTLYDRATDQPVYDTTSLYNNKSYVLNFKITPKRIPLLSDEDLETLLDMVVGYGEGEKNVLTDAKTKEIFEKLEKKYGKIFDYEGNTGTTVGIYDLIIRLADEDSCSWYIPGSEKIVEKKYKEFEGYRFEYVFESGYWQLKLVKVDSKGNLVKDSSGKYAEYFDEDGEYTIEAKFKPHFVTEFFKATDVDFTIFDENGKLLPSYQYLFNNGTQVDGIEYEYFTNADEKIILYYKDGDNYVVADETYEGDVLYVQRYKLTYSESYKEYGYKVPKMKVATEYNYVFGLLNKIGGNGKPLPATDAYGNVITQYLVDIGSGEFALREYKVDANGMFALDVDGNYIIVDEIEARCEFVDTYNYDLVLGTAKYKQTNNGAYKLRYVLENGQYGQHSQTIDYEIDENGNYVIYQENSVIKVVTYEVAVDLQILIESDENGALKKTPTENKNGGISYKVSWTIDASELEMPWFDSTNKPQYTGKTIYAKDVLKKFLPEFMEIVEGGEGIDAGTYTAKIRITTPNSRWRPEDTTDEFVYVDWTIDTVKVDLSEIKWEFHDGTGAYSDSSSFVYTRKNGNPVVFWVELANLPEVLKSRVIYSTNGIVGARAGINAGKYVTEYSFNIDSNFEPLDIPETLAKTVTWNIQRRKLTVPDVGTELRIFDQSEYRLLEILGVPEDWNEYYSIEVMYSNGGDYVPYPGHNGKPYTAYESGSYMFTFSILPGINTSETNPNVVWLKKATAEKPPEVTEPETPETPEEPVEEEAEISAYVAPAPVALAPVEEVLEEEVAEEVEVSEEIGHTTNIEARQLQTQVEIASVEETPVSALKEVCDRIKQLVCGAEVQLKSYRKYGMRGTL